MAVMMIDEDLEQTQFVLIDSRTKVVTDSIAAEG
jgi:hypothetical protein